MRTKILESYKRGFKHINDLCNFETVMLSESKVYRFKEHEYHACAGMHVLDVDDETLGKWLYLNQCISEAKITGDELLKVIASLNEL